jgi:hypothetical protein
MPYVIDVRPLAVPLSSHVLTLGALIMVFSRGRLLGLVLAILLSAAVAQADSGFLQPSLLAGSNQIGSSGFMTGAPAAVPPSDSAGSAWPENNVPAPRWTFWVGTIVLQRSRPSSQTLVLSDDMGFNANQIGFFIQAGPDLNAICHGEAFDLDFRYFHVNQAKAIDSMASCDQEFLMLHTPLFIDDSPVDFVYLTSLQSVEMNVRQNYSGHLTLLAGFRYVSLRDDLGAGFFPPGGAPWSTVHMVGINRLYGAQIGASMVLLDGGRWQIQCVSKAGLYGNGAQSLGVLASPQSSDVSNSVSRSLASFVGDINFTGVYAINDRWALRGGYQMLWLAGVALGSDQYATNSFMYAANASVADGNVFFQGGMASLQCSW